MTYGPRPRPLEERFWEHVNKGDGCWEWDAARSTSGYGQVRVNSPRRNVFAHRLSWTMAYGAIPDGLAVLHHCDNKPCVRPDHLFLGTLADNNRDMAEKGRVASGLRQGYYTKPGSIRRDPETSRFVRTRP